MDDDRGITEYEEYDMSDRPQCVTQLPDGTNVHLCDVVAIGPIRQCGGGVHEQWWFQVILHSGTKFEVRDADISADCTIDEYREKLSADWWEVLPV